MQLEIEKVVSNKVIMIKDILINIINGFQDKQRKSGIY